MKIMILGWYGTETIGDRAILAGLFSYFNQAFDDFEIFLGSLNPFFTDRTLNEDYSFYTKVVGKKVAINLFSSQNSVELDRQIRLVDFIVMGGGPLMDLNELHLIEYAFKKAKLLNKKTALLGTGIGPLFYDEYQKSVMNICLYSDLIILRDRQSKQNLVEIFESYNVVFDFKFVKTSLDPAVECTRYVADALVEVKSPYIAINMRKFPEEYVKYKDCDNINLNLRSFVEQISSQYQDSEIRLVPMHYFHIGNDDRFFLNQIALHVRNDNISVQNKNLSLEETMYVYKYADYNVGMRYHSIVLQTLLNGRNHILDYTEPRKGKIYGFLKDVDTDGYYSDKYINIQYDNSLNKLLSYPSDRFKYKNELLIKYSKVYIDAMRALWT